MMPLVDVLAWLRDFGLVVIAFLFVVSIAGIFGMGIECLAGGV